MVDVNEKGGEEGVLGTKCSPLDTCAKAWIVSGIPACWDVLLRLLEMNSFFKSNELLESGLVQGAV
jgi:hypothetical protein